ncbi:spermidine synthase [Actinorugispora endophytica]|uniref:Methyltransferase family protein n=1 Tax=Actinorugispora endophytica TaxID=1605990 RepID=A0A4R6V0L3_9ACTN|nr:fused MFS/spermidine synthase [Actinorugispora endophytica]TDQ52143.1 methyltransferase family protein [Actinorugispora endophytica]
MGRRDNGDARERPGTELLRDADRPDSWILMVGGTPQSHVDLADPTHLDFEYVRRLGHVVDLVAPEREPVDVFHLGAGALTLARYVAATRPGSRQRAVDIDPDLIALVRRELPWDRRADLRVGTGDARAWLTGRRDGSADLVVADVFSGARTPAHLTSVEFTAEASRVLRPGGVYAVNVGDGQALRHARSQVATAAAVFPHLALIAEPSVLRGRRFGNLVLLAGHRRLPVDELARRAHRDPDMARLLSGSELDRFASGAVPVDDATARDSPAPPDGVF